MAHTSETPMPELSPDPTGENGGRQHETSHEGSQAASGIGTEAARSGIRMAPTPRRWPSWLDFTPEEPERLPAKPSAILRRAMWTNRWHIAALTVAVSISYVSLALLPWAIGRLIDSGLHGHTENLLADAAVFLALVTLSSLNGLTEVLGVSIWMRASWAGGRRLMRVIFGRRTDVGRDVPSGDIVTAITQDGDRIGGLANFVPDAVASMIAAVVAITMMIRISVPLGLVVAIGMPVVMFLTSRVMKPLQARQAEQREESGILTSLATDGVAGLRVLRGVGGEDLYNERYAAQSARVRDAGMRVAPYRALLYVIQSAGANLFIAVVVGGGLLLAYDGSLSAGQLVAFYGYAGYLSVPLNALANALAFLSRARVGASKISKILAADYLASNARVRDVPEPEWATADLLDVTSGIVVHGGRVTALVSANPAETAALAARLARADDSAEVRVSRGVAAEEDARAAVANPGGPVMEDMRSYPVDVVRSNVVYSGPISELYSGTLRSNLLGPDAGDLEARSVREQIIDVLKPGGHVRPVLSEPPGERPVDPHLLEALHVADAADVLTSVRGGLDGQVAERGRSLSGGQRQRVALARAIAQEAPITIFVEPTSAVDSHTESRIAGRLAEHREGRTTVIVTVSPLVLGTCDEVILVEDGHEVARGTHHDLAHNAAYHAVVHRGEEEQR